MFPHNTHSSVLAWRIPGMGEHGGLPSLGSHRGGHDWSNLAAVAATLFRELQLGGIKACGSNVLWGELTFYQFHHLASLNHTHCILLIPYISSQSHLFCLCGSWDESLGSRFNSLDAPELRHTRHQAGLCGTCTAAILKQARLKRCLVPAVVGWWLQLWWGDSSRDHVLASLAVEQDVIPLLKGSGNVPACSS